MENCNGGCRITLLAQRMTGVCRGWCHAENQEVLTSPLLTSRLVCGPCVPPQEATALERGFARAERNATQSSSAPKEEVGDDEEEAEGASWEDRGAS